MSLDEMPDDILIHLLNASSPRDVARMKRLNRRFNQIVETYNIGKPEVDEFCVEAKEETASPPRKLGRIRFGNDNKRNTRKLVVTMKRERGVKRVERADHPSTSFDIIEENMRKVHLNDKLSFSGITIDSNFYRMLTSKWNNLRHVTTVSLSFCSIRLTWSEFVELLSRMTLRHLYLDFCTFDTSLISDKVLMELKHLETLKIQPRTHCFFNELTDNCLLAWSRRDKPPMTIQMYNCASRVTLEGIKSLMTTIISQQAESSIKGSIDWDFGLLLEPTQTDSVLLSLIFSSGLQLAVSDDFRSRRVQLTNRAEKLSLSFNIFHPFQATSHQNQAHIPAPTRSI